MFGFGWELNTILIVAYLWTIVGVIATVILENRNPFRTSAWVLLVGFLPFVGLIAYIIFGQEQRKLYRINKRYYKRLQRKPKTFSPDWEDEPIDAERLPWQKVIHLAEQNAHSILLSLDDSRVYVEGASFYDDLLADISRATAHIHIQSYIFDDDEVFAKLTAALIERRKCGVDVRVIYDYVGSYAVPRAKWNYLKEQGLLVYPFLPVRIPLLSSTVNYRNHRKVCVIDGCIAYIGGMNFANRYSRGNELGLWRDTHFRIEGQAVLSLQAGFLMDWYSVSRRVMPVERFYQSANVALVDTKRPRAMSQFVFGGPLEEYQAIEQLLITLIYQAQSYIRIETPYFLPTEALYSALIAVALSGVSVELMIPDSGDSRLTSLAMDSYLTPLMRAGGRVYRYTKGFLHSKLVIIDDQVSCIGSANIDFRSLEHNFEVMGIVYDKCLSRQLVEIYEQDKKDSQRLELSIWEQRPLSRRLSESVMRLFSPLL